MRSFPVHFAEGVPPRPRKGAGGPAGAAACPVLDFPGAEAKRRRRARREGLYFFLAVLPQDLSLGALALYGLLRLLLTPHIPFSFYLGPLTLLWPLSFFLLAVSYAAHCLLSEA